MATMSLMERMRYAMSAGREAWTQYGTRPGTTPADMYALRWSMRTGAAFREPLMRSTARNHPGIYRNTRMMWKHVEGLANFYATTVYHGELSTDGKPLPNGSRGAIPIDPQVAPKPEDPDNQNLLIGIAECNNAWNWRMQMTLRPTFGSVLGDGLTEIIDDIGHRKVYPSLVWPGYVKEIELDNVGNVLAHTIEFQVVEELPDGSTDSYLFTKMVDKETFRYFRDGKPFDQYGLGSVVVNPYGFDPAVWDRHQIGWDERGISAIDGVMDAVFEVNSLFSHAIDHQHKQFYAPIIIKGTITRPGQTQIELSKPPKNLREAASQRSWWANTFDMVGGSVDADLVQPVFDIGQTDKMLERLQQGVRDENPEAGFYHEMRQMSELTGPGAERALGDAVGRAKLARNVYDPGTVKIYQMSLAIGGMHANDGSWQTDANGRRVPLTKRQKVFLPFTLDSYHAGQLDFTISDRPVIPETDSERLDVIAQTERLQTTWGFEQFGIESDVAARIIKERNDNALVAGF